MNVGDKVTLKVSEMSPLYQTILSRDGIDESTVFTILSMGYDLAFIQSDKGGIKVHHQHFLSPITPDEVLT